MEKILLVIGLLLLIVFSLPKIAPRLFNPANTGGDVEWEQVNPTKQKEQHKKIIEDSKTEYKDFMEKQHRKF